MSCIIPGSLLPLGLRQHPRRDGGTAGKSPSNHFGDEKRDATNSAVSTGKFLLAESFRVSSGEKYPGCLGLGLGRLDLSWNARSTIAPWAAPGGSGEPRCGMCHDAGLQPREQQGGAATAAAWPFSLHSLVAAWALAGRLWLLLSCCWAPGQAAAPISSSASSGRQEAWLPCPAPRLLATQMGLGTCGSQKLSHPRASTRVWDTHATCMALGRRDERRA